MDPVHSGGMKEIHVTSVGVNPTSNLKVFQCFGLYYSYILKSFERF